MTTRLSIDAVVVDHQQGKAIEAIEDLGQGVVGLCPATMKLAGALHR